MKNLEIEKSEKPSIHHSLKKILLRRDKSNHRVKKVKNYKILKKEIEEDTRSWKALPSS